jgi:hypothetical protein
MRLTGRTARILLGPIEDAERVADGSAAKGPGVTARAHEVNPTAVNNAAALKYDRESGFIRCP